MQAIIAGLFPWSHHWIFPIMAGLLLAQTWLFKGRGPVGSFVGLSLLLLGIAVARLPTIAASHHLILFSMAFALAAVLYWRLAAWAGPSSAWRVATRWCAMLYAVVAVASALLAWRLGIWWGIADGT